MYVCQAPHTKLKLCKTLIKPVLMYESETSALKETVINQLSIFEENNLRKNISVHPG